MNNLVLSSCLLILSFAASASTLVHNINGYTMNDGQVVRFAALEFDGGRVSRLYNSAEEATKSKADTSEHPLFIT